MKAEKIVSLLREKKLKITVAESMTGGLIAKTLTDVPGASDVFEYGFIPYSDSAKQKILNVPENILQKYSAISKETVASMLEGAKHKSNAHVAVAVTGNAGGLEKKKGSVFIGIQVQNKVEIFEKDFFGTRDEIRKQTLDFALQILLEKLKNGR
ncbi:MAG: CinA family protein [Deltaproteobacteria bacterium]|nr:CinA family protein [Deltaproteobacteria bacterium]